MPLTSGAGFLIMNTVMLSRGELPNFTLQVDIFVSCMDFPGVQSLLDG